MEEFVLNLKTKLEREANDVASLLDSMSEEGGASSAVEMARATHNHPADSALGLMEKELAVGNVVLLKELLKDIRHALRKLDTCPEKFGMCERCGKPIDRERLEARPWARYCISCKQKIEAKTKGK